MNTGRRGRSLGAWTAAIVLLVAALGAAALVPAAVRAVPPERLDPWLANYWQAKPGDTSFLVVMKVQADLDRLPPPSQPHSGGGTPSRPDRAARGQQVTQALRDVAAASQANLRAELDRRGVAYHPLFIVNAIQVTGDEALARELAMRPDVARVVADPDVTGLDDPPAADTADGQDDATAPTAVDFIEWNIVRTNADDVWALGYTGQNIVVGSCDTGVEWDHPALVNQYRGGPGDHDYNWYDTFHEYSEPTDPNGHGTHTTGTMVGDDGSTNQIGMAPGAQWIACKANSGDVWKASKYLECWEWFLAPTRQDGSDPRPDLAPHVINNSWSCPGSEGCDPDTLRMAAQSLYAAGIAIAKSGGNSGSSCGTITNPGQYPELLATAAFASGDTIAGFSSRGPVTVDGEQRIKPDIAAPGVSIRSAYPGGGYTSLGGTSMAAPHTAGLIALLWSANPALIGDLENTFLIVKSTAEPKLSTQCPPLVPSGVPNNVWGWGIIDALAAVQTRTLPGLGTLSGTVTDNSTGTPLEAATLDIVQVDTGLSRQVPTGPAGFYTETLLAVTYNVTATLYGYLPEAATGMNVVSNTVTTLNLALNPAPVWSLSGQVTDQMSGAPLGDVLVRLVDTWLSTSSHAVTGEYALPAVAQGRYRMQITKAGYVPQERDIDVQDDLVEDFELVPEPTYLVRHSDRECGSAFDWIDITTTGTPRSLADDAATSVSLPAGRSFSFYGQGYTGLYIGSNGYVTFGAGSTYPGGNSIPSTFLPNNAIYAFWDDLNPAGGTQGQIYTELVADHLFVIEFYEVQHFPSGNPETFEIVLDLDTGAIRLQYLFVSDTSRTTVGVENAAGTSAVVHSYHELSMVYGGLALALYPVTGEHAHWQGEGWLQGTVSAAGDGPIEGATVQAEGAVLGAVVTFTTGIDGQYVGSLCADRYALTASAPGYRPAIVESRLIVSGTTTIQDFVLDRAEADLWLTKTAPATVAPGHVLTYTLAFGSNGPDPVPSSEIRDLLPPEVTWISGGSYDPGTHSASWSWFDLLPGYPATVTLVVQVAPDITATEMCNSAGVQAVWASAPLDPTPGNNTGSVCTTISAAAPYSVFLPIVVKQGP